MATFCKVRSREAARTGGVSISGAAAAGHGLKPMTAKDHQRIAKHLYGILGS
jgi:hypothetical protein